MESSSSPPIIRIFLSFNTLSSVRRNGQRRFRVRGGEERAGHFQSGVEDHEQRPERELESRCRPDISTERAPALDVRRISDLRPTRPKREPPLALFILVYGSFFFFFLFPFSLSLSLSLASWKPRVDAREPTVVVGLRLRLSRVLNGSTLMLGSVLARMSRLLYWDF